LTTVDLLYHQLPNKFFCHILDGFIVYVCVYSVCALYWATVSAIMPCPAAW